MAKTPRKAASKRPAAQKRKTPTPNPADALEQTREFRWRDRRDLLDVSIVFVVAIILRLVFYYFNQRNNPVFSQPIMDALYHHEWALSIVDGSKWSNDVYYRGPLYPYMLAFLYMLSGASIAFAVFIQHVLGAITSGAVYLLAREYFDRRVSLVAGLTAALYWPFVYFEGDLLIVTTILLLNTVALILLARSIRISGRRGWFMLGATGLVFGLSAIARPSILIFFPALPLVFYWTGERGKRQSRLRLARSAVTIGAIAVVILPVMVRNYMVAKAVVPVAASGGVNFYIGNNAASDGSSAIIPGTRADLWGGYEDAIQIAENAEGRKLNLAEVSDFYFRRGWEWIKHNPGDAASHFAKKFQIFWSGPERANNKFIYFFWNLAGMRYVPLPGFWLVTPLAILGAALQWRRRRWLSPLFLFVLTYMVGVVVFFVNARFRLPVVPVLIIFAGFAAVYLFDTVRRKDTRALTASVAFVVAFLVVNIDYLTFGEIRSYSNAFSEVTLGNAYYKSDQWDTALDHYARAWSINEENPTPAFEQYLRRDVAYNLGQLYWHRGLCSRAIEKLRLVGAPRGGGVDIYMLNALEWLGDCYIKRKQYGNASVVFKEFLRLAPDDIRAVAGMATVEAAAGHPEEAERMLEAAIDPGAPVYVPSYLALADIKRQLGKTDEAIAAYEMASKYSGYGKTALTRLAELYEDIGDVDAAIATLRRASKFYPPGDRTVPDWINRLESQRRTEEP